MPYNSGSGNNAILVNGDFVNGNPIDVPIQITYQGSDWYYTVCACMTFATFVFLGLGFTKPRTHRIFHYITAGVTMVAAIAYFSMGSNLGWVAIPVEFVRTGATVSGNAREIFYVRYIDWFVTTPLLLTDLLLTAAMPGPTILFVILADEVMIVTGLIGALVSSSYKWGYFAFGTAALMYILYHLVWEARIHANAVSKEAGRAFLMCGSLTALLWLLYPIAWGVCEGGNVIGADGEAIFYGILDLLAKPVFGAMLIFGHRNIDPATLGIHIRDYTSDDVAVREKGHGLDRDGHHHGNGVSNGAVNGTNGNGVVDGTHTNGVAGTTAV